MSVVEVSRDFGGRLLTLQTGKLAKQADASVVVRYGDTVVLVAVVAAKKLKEGQDFFPLTVDFQEKYYSAGKIPGGFFKREAKPSDKATLSARMIDRPMRPLFPEDYMCETNVTVTVLSFDGVNDADIAATIGASAATHISDIPWAGPVAACRVGLINDQMTVNPSPADLENSNMELLVAGVPTGVIMVEGSAKEVSEKVMNDALVFAHDSMKPVFEMIEELREKTGSKKKRDYDKPLRDDAFKADIKKVVWSSFDKAFAVKEKLARYQALAELKDTVKAKFGIAEPKTKAEVAKNGLITVYYEELKATYARELTLNKKHRIDGRKYSDIRNITCETGFLPRVHGSGLFTRGETQVLAAVTLGTSDDEQRIDSISGNYQKTFLLHYNFPPFSVGEARPLRPPGRREIGHGFLAERALTYVLPPNETFPYTIRLVSEVLESNGSSSMATVCSGSMALMDAGVPITKPVAGVAMGLIKEGEKFAVLSDILGDEDHLGDMDFKVCGTAEGITAFQMDLKIGGVSREIMEQALEQAREGRIHILGEMAKTISTHKAEFSPYAPRIFTIKVKPDKVREVIGSGGKVIRSIIERTGVKIDIEDDGSINIASSDNEAAQRAIEIINGIVEEPEIGRIYEGRVSRIAEFGAFIEIIPGTDGLCHISELAPYRVRRVEDILKEGDVLRVKCLDVDSQGKIRLSRKALLNADGEPIEAEGSDAKGGKTESSEGETKPEVEAKAAGEETAPAEAQPAVEGQPEARVAAPDEDRFNRADRPARPTPSDDRPDRSFGRPSEGGDRDRGPDRSDRPERPSMDRDRGDRDRGPSRDDRPPRSGGGDRGGRSFGDRDRGPDRGPRTGGGDRGGFDRGGRGGGGGDRGPRGGSDRGGYDRGGRSAGGGDRDRGPDRGPAPDRGGDRGPSRGGFDRDRGPSMGGDRDRGPSRDDRGPRGDDRGNRAGGGEDRGNRRDEPVRTGGYDRGPRGGGSDRGGYDRGGRSGGGGGDRGGRGGQGGGSRFGSGGGRSSGGGDRDRGPRGGGDRGNAPDRNEQERLDRFQRQEADRHGRPERDETRERGDYAMRYLPDDDDGF